MHGREVSSKVLELQRRTHGHHRWMFSHVVLAGLNDSMSAIYELDGSEGCQVAWSKSIQSLICHQ